MSAVFDAKSKTEPACLVQHVLTDFHCPLFILSFCLFAAAAATAAHANAPLPYLTGLPWIHQ